jgi:hypothetical protein
MPIVSTDIKSYYSGGCSNTDPAASIGGARSTTEVNWAALFDTVSSAEGAAGDVEYRCVYFFNDHPTLTLEAAKVWIQANTPSADTTIDIGLAAAGASATETAVANESTAPAGVTFLAAANEGTALSLGNLAPDAYHGVWVRRTVTAGAAAASDTFTVRVKGDTAA